MEPEDLPSSSEKGDQLALDREKLRALKKDFERVQAEGDRKLAKKTVGATVIVRTSLANAEIVRQVKELAALIESAKTSEHLERIDYVVRVDRHEKILTILEHLIAKANDYQTTLALISRSLGLGHVLHWSEPAMEKVVKKGLQWESVEDLARFLQAHEEWHFFWEHFKRSLQQEGIKGKKWFEKAFLSIRQGAKGLYDALCLDYALISVPPPLELWQRVLTGLEEAGIFGITAPPGWGKSRLVLWIALARALKGGHAIYYAEPKHFIGDLDEFGERQPGDLRTFLRSLADHRAPSLLIIDDCHRWGEDTRLLRVIQEVTGENPSGRPPLGLRLLLLQTRQPQDREDRAWPAGLPSKCRFTSKEYSEFWARIWKERFTAWFGSLIDEGPDLQMRKDRLKHAEKTKSPWAFVSVLADLRQLLKKQLGQLSDRIVFSMVQYGFVITNEEGLSPEAFFNGFHYLYEKAQEGQPPFDTYWEQIKAFVDDDLWESVADNNAGSFSRHLKILVEKWQQTPEHAEHIRLLPHPGLDTSYKRARPIKSYHAEWWTALRNMWTEDPDWQAGQDLLGTVQQAVLSGTPILIGKLLTRAPGNVEAWSALLRHCCWLEDLDLTHMALDQLPEAILQWRRIKTLTLSGNELTELPESFGNLVHLQKLDLSANKLASLPESVGALANLERLFLLGNRLTTLPKSVGRLSNLESLDLSYNGLTTLPESVGALAKLERLVLPWNKLTTLPKSVGALAKLERLVLWRNKLTTLPESVGDLTNLKTLWLSNNDLTTLPKSVGRLSNLESLDLSYNGLTTLPETFGDLTNLKTLQLSNNDLTTLPESVGQLSNLQILDLDNNKLVSLPESLKRLDQLHSLNLEGNPELGKTAKEVGKLWDPPEGRITVRRFLNHLK